MHPVRGLVSRPKPARERSSIPPTPPLVARCGLRVDELESVSRRLVQNPLLHENELGRSGGGGLHASRLPHRAATSHRHPARQARSSFKSRVGTHDRGRVSL